MSKPFSLNKEDLKKLGIGLGIAVLGAIATYLQEAIPHTDFGSWTPLVVAINSVLVNTLRKFITGV